MLIYCSVRNLCFLLCLFLLYKWQFGCPSVGLLTEMLINCVFCHEVYSMLVYCTGFQLYIGACLFAVSMHYPVTVSFSECWGRAAGAFCGGDEV